MAKNEISKRDNSSPVYREKDISKKTTHGRRVVVEHVEDYPNGVTIDRQVQEETIISEETIHKEQ